MRHTIGISQMATTSARDDVLVTYSLGSCVGLALHDPKAGVAGMIHCMLPLSRIDPIKAQSSPCMFVDTGVPSLLQQVLELGAHRENIVAWVAGAASLLGQRQLFKIGVRNYTVLRKILWKNDILISGENVGGTVARTMSLDMASGEARVKSAGQEVQL